jgi:hypothetical protein
MGVRRKTIGVWLENAADHPWVDRVFDQWYATESYDDFSQYWNKTIQYPRCRFYSLRRGGEWRFNFDNEADLITFLLGGTLSAE